MYYKKKICAYWILVTRTVDERWAQRAIELSKGNSDKTKKKGFTKQQRQGKSALKPPSKLPGTSDSNEIYEHVLTQLKEFRLLVAAPFDPISIPAPNKKVTWRSSLNGPIRHLPRRISESSGLDIHTLFHTPENELRQWGRGMCPWGLSWQLLQFQVD